MILQERKDTSGRFGGVPDRPLLYLPIGFPVRAVIRPLSVECRLVFRTADRHCAPSEIGALVNQVTDWERVVAIAERELAITHLARALPSNGEGVPPEVFAVVRRRAQAVELRMQYFARRLEQTCSSLAARDIPFILLKGAAVGAIVDPSFRSRPMNDADVLVRQEDAARAGVAIEAARWTPTPDQALRVLLADAHHLPPFLDPQMPEIRLELHVSHLPTEHPFDFDVATLWRDARPAAAPFQGALVPSLEHILLHAAVHFAWQHPISFGAWRTFRVFSIVTAMPEFSWERFEREAIRARAVTACYWTLRLAARLSGVPVPDEVLRRLTPPTPRWLLDALERHFIATIAVGEYPSSPSVRLNQLLWLAAIRPEWSGHATSRRWDHENRWGQAYGITPVSWWTLMWRHVTGYRRWFAFVVRTLAAAP
jgi:hypothetical protein